MPDVELSARADRTPLEQHLAAGVDFEIRLILSGPDVAGSTARLVIAGELAIDAPQRLVHAFISQAIGRPAREWMDVAGAVALPLLVDPTRYSTTEQNLAKAVFMMVQWLEPQLIAPTEVTDLAHELRDEIIIDYGGEEGRQRYIYFLGSEPTPQVAARLHRLHLLCTVDLRIGAAAPIHRHFVPLVVPGVSPHRFDDGMPNGGRTYGAWQAIRADMGRRVDSILRRQ